MDRFKVKFEIRIDPHYRHDDDKMGYSSNIIMKIDNVPFYLWESEVFIPEDKYESTERLAQTTAEEVLVNSFIRLFSEEYEKLKQTK